MPYRPRCELNKRLSQLPAEIASGVKPEAIVKAMSESFRQQVQSTGLQETQPLLSTAARDLKKTTKDLGEAIEPITAQPNDLAYKVESRSAELNITHGKDSCWIVTLPSWQKSDWEWLVTLNIRHRPGISKRRATSGGQSANVSPDMAMPLYGFNPFSFINTYNHTSFEAGGLGCAMNYPARPRIRPLRRVSNLVMTIRYLLFFLGACALAAQAPEAFSPDQYLASHCLTCHGSAAIRRAPARATLHSLSPEAVYSAITIGPMKPMTAGLTDAQRTAVAEALTEQKLGVAALADAKAMSNPCPSNPPLVSPIGVVNGYGTDLANSRFVPGKVAGLSLEQVAHLKPKWAFGFPAVSQMLGQPQLAVGVSSSGRKQATSIA